MASSKAKVRPPGTRILAAVRGWYSANRSARGDLFRAFRELFRARLGVHRLSAPELMAMSGDPSKHPRSEWADRVAFAIPRVAAWLPWRSDCLVQAVAARRWLAKEGIPSSLRMGVRKDGRQFGAHAWLVAGGRVVTGMPIDSYVPLEPGGDATDWMRQFDAMRNGH